MRIGISFDLKADLPQGPDSGPDDAHEEFDSPVTVEAIATALRKRGHEVVLLGDGRELLEKVLAAPPDLVFNFAEGHGTSRSREARVPAVLEMLGIPYTGSDPLTCAVTLDKDAARRLVASAGVRVPRGRCFAPGDDLGELADLLDGPVIVKPAWEGSSKGIRGKCVADTLADARAAVEGSWAAYPQPVLVEEFIAGDELTVGMLGNPPTVVGVMSVHPVTATERFVYSLEVKRDYLRQVRYECPATLPPGGLAEVERAARTAWRVLGCRDVARIDFRYRDGVPYFLEVNPLPGLNPESSDLVIMGRLVGWDHDRLVGAIVDAAMARVGA